LTPATKVTRTAAWGAEIVQFGDDLAEAAAHARDLARRDGLVFIHPYDDPDVIAGQGTEALEMLEDAPDLDAIIIPVGGGGLLAGCLIAAMTTRPGISVYGVEVQSYAPMAQKLAGRPVSVGGATIAEGIAVRDIGQVPFDLVRRRVSDVLVVPERAIEEAVGLLVEDGKTVAEGAGAAGIAAVLTYPERFRGKKVGVPFTGGNIDARILADVLPRNLLRDGRLLRLHFEIPDRPGVLADIATKIATHGGNILEVSHHQLHLATSAQAAQLKVMVEARDPAHATTIVGALEAAYVVRRV